VGYAPTGFNYGKNEFGRVNKVGAEKVGASSVYFRLCRNSIKKTVEKG
jgi:hypothetical protein